MHLIHNRVHHFYLSIILCLSVFVLQISFAKLYLTDSQGRAITLEQTAQRIYIGFYYEDFLAINGKEGYDRVVAYSKADWTLRSSQWPLYEAAIPRLKALTDVGSLYNNSFDFEKLIQLKPDLLILAKWQLEGFANHFTTLEQLKIPYVVVDFNEHHIPTQVASINVMGQALGNKARAQTLANEYVQGYQLINERLKSTQHARPIVYLELGNKGAQEYSSSYSSNIWGPILTTVGADNIATGIITNPAPLSPEYVLSRDPARIFIAGGDWPNLPDALNMGFGVNVQEVNTRLTQFAARPGWSELNAIKKGALYALYHPGARTIHDYIYAQYLAKMLYPELFGDIDPQLNHRRFYETYLPIIPVGTFMHQYTQSNHPE